jgi:hypothetical protein
MRKLKTSVDVVDAMRGINLRVDFRRVRELSWRIWLGTKLIGLAARIMNCGIEFEKTGESD